MEEARQQATLPSGAYHTSLRGQGVKGAFSGLRPKDDNSIP